MALKKLIFSKSKEKHSIVSSQQQDLLKLIYCVSRKCYILLKLTKMQQYSKLKTFCRPQVYFLPPSKVIPQLFIMGFSLNKHLILRIDVLWGNSFKHVKQQAWLFRYTMSIVILANSNCHYPSTGPRNGWKATKGSVPQTLAINAYPSIAQLCLYYWCLILYKYALFTGETCCDPSTGPQALLLYKYALFCIHLFKLLRMRQLDNDTT